MPHIRPGRVRTRNTNRRPALLLSSMSPQDYNVRPAEVKSIACPDCRTWRRIIGETTLKIRPHGLDQGKLKEGEKRPLCPGSDQLVEIDIDVRSWQARQDRLLRDAMPSEIRRAAQQFYKPVPAPAAPVSRITAEVTVETARQSYLAHRHGCTGCVGGEHRRHCTDGGILARRYVLALQEEPARREAREQLERQEQRVVRQRSAPAVRRAQWARHGGEDVERANNLCTARTSGSVSEFRGPALPMLPYDVEAHDRRQAELGRQYASRKAPATSAV